MATTTPPPLPPTLYDMLENTLTCGNGVNTVADGAVQIARQCRHYAPIRVGGTLDADTDDNVIANLTVQSVDTTLIINNAMQMAGLLVKYLYSVDGQFTGSLKDELRSGIDVADGVTILRYCSAVAGALLGQLTAETFDMRPLTRVVCYRNPLGQLAVLCAYIHIIDSNRDTFKNNFSSHLARYSPFSPYNMMGMLSDNGTAVGVFADLLQCDMMSIVLLSVLAEQYKF